MKVSKPVGKIQDQTLLKLNKFLCSKEGGGELNAEQSVAIKKVEPVIKKKSVDKSSQASAETNNSSSKKQKTAVEVADSLAQKLIKTGDISGKKPNKITKKEQLMTKKSPDFMLEENRIDSKKRRPSDPNYDPSSVFISPEEFEALTDGMKRYWDIKKDNMDKIVLYRFGDWYVLYYDDLSIASKLIELTIVPMPSCGTP